MKATDLESPQQPNELWIPRPHTAGQRPREISFMALSATRRTHDGHMCLSLTRLDLGTRRMITDDTMCYDDVGTGRRLHMEALQAAVTQLVWDEWVHRR
jgi:hypothetical protein